MAAASQLGPRYLDLTTRSIDLTKVLIEVSNSRGGLLEVGIQIGQWLQHEGLDRHELQDFFHQAHELAMPNANGLEFHQRVRNTHVVKPLLPLFLQPSGSLGRLLIVDPALCWIVSTIGCLFRFHPDYEVTEVVVGIIAEKRQDIYLQSINGMPEASRIRLESVVKKIVSSVWYNIINSGTNPMALPNCLDRLCAKGHSLDLKSFGKVVAALEERRKSVMIRSDRLHVNLALWLLVHFHGRLFVTVAGTIILDEKLGQEATEIELRVKASCTDDCEIAGVLQDVEILGVVGATFDVFLTVPTHNLISDSQTRQDLYSATLGTETWRTILPESSKIWTRCTAQQIMKWILSLPVGGLCNFSRPFSLSVDPNVESEKGTASGLKVLDIVKRSPAILNKRWGNKPPSLLVYSQVIENAAEKDGKSDLSSREIQPEELASIWPYFPILRELVASVKTQCECGYCVEESSDEETCRVVKEGCYAHQALVEVMVLLSHGIADSLGVDDVSSHSDKDSLIGIVAILLCELVQKQMKWDTWFYVSSSVLLGCSFPKIPCHDGNSLCAVQHGNLAAVAGWLDLNQELAVEGSFSLRSGEGKLGTMNELDNGMQFRGLVGDYVTVGTEGTEEASGNLETKPRASEPQDPRLEVLFDDTKVESDLFLVNVDRQRYRLLTRIRTDHHSRLVDPATAITEAIRRLPLNGCSQDHLSKKPCKTEGCISTYSFDEILGHWQCFTSGNNMNLNKNTVTSSGGICYHVSQLLDSNLKLNVAYTLSQGNLMVFNHGVTCIGCAIARCQSYDKGGDEVHNEEAGCRHKQRFIVNVAVRNKRPRLLASRLSGSLGDGTSCRCGALWLEQSILWYLAI